MFSFKFIYVKTQDVGQPFTSDGPIRFFKLFAGKNVFLKQVLTGGSLFKLLL